MMRLVQRTNTCLVMGFNSELIVDFFHFLEVWIKKLTCTLYGHTKMCTSVFSLIPQGNEKKSTVSSYNLISYHFHTKSNGKQPKNKTKFNFEQKAQELNLPTTMTEGLFNYQLFQNAQIKAVKTVSISLLSATFLCVLHLWFKRCCCDVVYNDITRGSKACSLTLCHFTENRYVKYPVHKIHGDMNQLF